jgi:hypothetical protein
MSARAAWPEIPLDRAEKENGESRLLAVGPAGQTPLWPVGEAVISLVANQKRCPPATKERPHKP